MLPEPDSDGALHVATATQGAVARLSIPNSQCSTGPHLSIRTGIAAICQGEAMTAQRMIETADKALYEAKKAGRNRFGRKDVLALKGSA